MDVLKRFPLASALAILAGVLVLVLGLEYGSSAALHDKAAAANPAARPPVPVAQPIPGQGGTPPTPAVNPGSLFGPRPGGLSPGNSSVPVADPNTAGQAPLTPEELLARRRARRTQQSQ